MRVLLTWIVLAALWVGLSGHLDALHLGFGALSVTFVALLSHRLLMGKASLGRSLARLARLLIYVPWLLWQIVLANWDVILCVLGLRPISPCIVRLTPSLEGDFGRVTYANSITLTPGTITVDVSGDSFVVHALSRGAAEGLSGGAMERRVRWVESGR